MLLAMADDQLTQIRHGLGRFCRPSALELAVRHSLDAVHFVAVIVPAASFALAASSASIDGHEQNEVDNEQNVAQHQDDAQRRLIGPEAKNEPTFTSDADRRHVVDVVHWRRHRRRGARLRRHYTRINQRPFSSN